LGKNLFKYKDCTLLFILAEAIEYLNHFYDNEAELARSEVLRYLTGLEQARLAEDQLPGQDIPFVQASQT
jgi:hypothetical protein